MIVAFTGHRPDKLGGYKIPNPTYTHITEQLATVLAELKPEKAISGMALGWDQWAAQICIKLDIPFIAAIPFIGQERIWPEPSKETYIELVGSAVEKVIVCEGGYAPWKMQERNKWMVDHCDQLIACYNGDASGGTYNCVKYAEKQGKEIIIIDPSI